MNTRPVVPDQCHSQTIPDSCIAQQAGQLGLRLDVETMEPLDSRKPIEQLMNILIHKVLQQFHLIQIYRKVDVFNRACFPVKHQLLSWQWSQSAHRMSHTNNSLKMIDRSQVLSQGTSNQTLYAVKFRNAVIYPLTISLALLVNRFHSKFHPP